jgi:hypothetical protein
MAEGKQYYCFRIILLICDSIPKRRELVKEAARDPNSSELKASRIESQTHAWTYCPLSQRPLAEPIVSDCMGVLYNKDAIIEHLLPSDDANDSPTRTEHEEVLAGRVKSLRDVVEVKFQVDKGASDRFEKRICPITSKELGAHTKAVYLVPCGHAFSEVAIKEVPGEACLQCNEPYEQENIIPILPLLEEDKSRLAERIQRLKDNGLTHSLKKAHGNKKRKKNGKEEAAESKVMYTQGETTNNSDVEKIKATAGADLKISKVDGATPEPPSRSGTATPLGGIKNAATASLTAKVLEEQEARNKRRKLGMNDNIKTLFSSSGANGQAEKKADFMTRGFSIPRRA